jgi:anaerobic ribonucleoside-triphosphate reductase activating protein
MNVAINKVHFPVTTLGFGRRLGIWMQGCSIQCPGCLSRDTWAATTEHQIAVDQLVASCASRLVLADGVTISGGEPFDQAGALAELIQRVRVHCDGDVLVYSGYPLETLTTRHRKIISSIDVLISDPFVAEAGETLALRGSDNQRITLLTALAQERYSSDIDRAPWSAERRLDVVVEEDEVWMSGIPRRGDLKRLRGELSARGFAARTSDQRAIRT